MKRRKMKREEEAVDIDEIEDPSEKPLDTNGAQNGAAANGTADLDEDALWADEESDDDVRGWRLKVVVSTEDD